jgi:outer membrane protein TolC
VPGAVARWLRGTGIVLCAAAGQVAGAQVPAQVPSAADSSLLARVHAGVRRSNPDVLARRAALEAAQARAAATGYPLPLFLTGELEEVPSGLDASRAGSIRLAVEKDFLSGARRASARAVAQTDVQAAVAWLDAAERRAVALADRAVVRSLVWPAIARRLASEDSLLASAEVSLRTRYAVADARYVDVLRLRTERLRVQNDRAAVVTEALVARRSLDALMMPGDSAALAVRQVIDSTIARAGIPTLALGPPPSVDSLLAASAAARVGAAAVARARASHALLLAEQRPRVSGFAGAQRFSTDNGQFTVGPVIGASVSLPFTARRANRAAGVAAERDVVAALASRDAALTTVRAELRAARDRYDAARTRMAVFDAALLRGAREERESALASYRGAEISLLELLDFERALARAEIDRMRSQIDAADALSDLIGGAFGSVAETRGGSTPAEGPER